MNALDYQLQKWSNSPEGDMMVEKCNCFLSNRFPWWENTTLRYSCSLMTLKINVSLRLGLLNTIRLRITFTAEIVVLNRVILTRNIEIFLMILRKRVKLYNWTKSLEFRFVERKITLYLQFIWTGNNWWRRSFERIWSKNQ